MPAGWESLSRSDVERRIVVSWLSVADRRFDKFVEDLEG